VRLGGETGADTPVPVLDGRWITGVVGVPLEVSVSPEDRSVLDADGEGRIADRGRVDGIQPADLVGAVSALRRPAGVALGQRGVAGRRSGTSAVPLRALGPGRAASGLAKEAHGEEHPWRASVDGGRRLR